MVLKNKVKVVELRDSSGTIERKTKVHAQRKFAQGSPSFIIARDREAKENGFSNQNSHPNGVTVPDMAQDVMLDKCPRTDDFLSFLCFRGTNILPESLNYFGDPRLHNYPDGRPPTPEAPKAVTSNSVPAKLENGHKAESKAGDAKSPLATQPALKAPEKKIAPLINGNNKKKNANTQPKNKVTTALKITKKIITPLQKPNLPRIHSNFRRSTNISRILTRRVLGKSDTPSPANKKKVAKALKTKKISSISPRKVLTRLQKRSNSNHPESEDNSYSSSESSSSSEDESSEAESSSSSEPSPPVKNSKKMAKTIQKPKSDKAKTTSSKKSVKAARLPISKNTRLSSSRKSNQVSSPASSALKKVRANSPKNSPTTRKALRDASVSKPSPSSSLRRLSTNSVSQSKTSEKSPASSPSKMTREAARKLAMSTKSSPLVLPSIGSRRNALSRRTKEAATFYMTLIGQEEDLDSSEVEEEASKEESQSSVKKKKTSSVDSNRKRPASPPPSPIRTRRTKASSSSSVSGSSETKKRAILKEAAKRFEAVQSSSSSEESSDSSSSEEENEKVKTPQRNIKTRSSNPSKASTNSTGIAGIVRLPEESPLRQTRAASNKKPVPPTKPPPVKSKKAAPVKAEPAARKRPVPVSRTVVTPPLNYDISSLLEAPVFHPSEKEFTDPLEYLAKIREESERFGICRIVPPASFKPECQLSDGMRFTAYNQYVHRMFRRRGTNSRILEAIHLHLEAQDINCHPPPCIGGIEVDLPGLYNAVENLGGPGEVMVHGLWSTVADMLKIPRASPDRLSKLDTIYCKYLLPYATLSEDERNKLLQEADAKHLERQGKRLEDNEEEDEDNESIVRSSSTALSTFYRVARNTMALWFPSSSSGNTDAVSVVDPEKAEATYWKLVTERNEHVCVHSANIDSGQYGYGFPCNKSSRHPWNLKVLTNNNGSVLRSLGSVPGCTAPTLHVGMLFSASCWYRDPHGLPWIDYLHTGAHRIWYGAPTSQEPVLKKAMTKLVPDLVKSDKSVWLSSDTVMVPPTMLADEGVSLSRTVQQSGQYIVVWPRAFSSSVCTGYTVSESVYFAPPEWLPIGDACFKELRVNCEPAVFSLHQLLWNIARDSRTTTDVLKRVLPLLQTEIEEELEVRRRLKEFGVNRWEKLANPVEPESASNNKKRRPPSTVNEEDEECELCRSSLFFSRVELHSPKDVDDPTIWCLTHALEKIKERSKLIQQLQVRFAHEEDELKQLLQTMRDQIKTKTVRRNVPQQKH